MFCTSFLGAASGLFARTVEAGHPAAAWASACALSRESTNGRRHSCVNSSQH